MSLLAAPGVLAEAKPVRSHLAAILAIAIVARVAFTAVNAHLFPYPPLARWGYENVSIALSLHSGHGFGSPFYFSSGPTVFMTPG
jgi:hypothetical protein